MVKLDDYRAISQRFHELEIFVESVLMDGLSLWLVKGRRMMHNFKVVGT